jgi:hypothetical protein
MSNTPTMRPPYRGPSKSPLGYVTALVVFTKDYITKAPESGGFSLLRLGFARYGFHHYFVLFQMIPPKGETDRELRSASRFTANLNRTVVQLNKLL